MLIPKILCFGSLNIDHVYQVPRFVLPGETFSALTYKVFPGGKGLNQSVALARSGVKVWHAGKVGKEGIFLVEELSSNGVETQYIQIEDAPTGHAIIQIDDSGQNSILLYPGANQLTTVEFIEETLESFAPNDFLVLQNEVANVPKIIEIASKRGMKVVFNPSPMTKDILDYPLERVDYFILNEIEGAAISGSDDPDCILRYFASNYNDAQLVLTLGGKGVLYQQGSKRLHIEARKVVPLDTTAAGDTFLGYFVGAVAQQTDVHSALCFANLAASICVTREGAASSIPTLDEVRDTQQAQDVPN